MDQENDLKCIKVSLCKNGVTIEVLGIYRSPATNVDQFIIGLNNILQDSQRQPKQIQIFAGDTNLNLLDKNSKHTSSYLDTLCSFSFVSAINKATRVSPTSETSLFYKI
ncbi:hypothetical protein WA026_012302 [Henosepilachna vigintioctopunctata]|uniref:Endonuclease/exonuclease/phosphatase domain-containing protein n=1 Tax=Henosepilachna vigintioctopunctata TaxID=420089 RepID=A0AAW1UPX4_9CUCU